MDKFEYKTLFTDAKGWLGGKIDEISFQDDLNELGESGWELVSSFPSNQDFGSTRWVVSIFKRMKN